MHRLYSIYTDKEEQQQQQIVQNEETFRNCLVVTGVQVSGTQGHGGISKMICKVG